MKHTWAAASEPKLETSVKMSDPVIHAFHKLGIFLVKSGLVRVPGSKVDFHFATCGLNKDFIIFLSFTMTPAWRTFLFITEDFITIQNHGQQLAQEG